jgi:hypothetical protein
MLFEPLLLSDALCAIGIELAGIYELLITGSKHNYKLHSRFFYVRD